MSETQVVTFAGLAPRLGREVFLAPGARVVGDVRLGDRVSIWFNAVLRGDINRVEVGAGSNVQDNSTLHVDDDHPCIVGRDVVIGHAVLVHGATVEDRCLVGMGAVLMNGVRVGAGSVVAAGAVLPQGLQVPPGHVVMGVGGKIVKPLPPDFWDREPLAAAKYRRLAATYAQGLPWKWPDPEWEKRDAEALRGSS